MRYLLDTHTLLWFLQNAPELPDAVAARIEAEDAINHVSMASVWELSSPGRRRPVTLPSPRPV